MITVFVSQMRGSFFPFHQVQSQDLGPLFLLSGSMLVVAFRSPAWRLPARLPQARWLWIAGLAIAGLLGWGCHALMGNFPLSADERMVVFDMAVFEHLRLATPLAADWRPFAKALTPAFLLFEQMPTGVVSAYLPMNALLRLAFAKVADPALFNPLLALAGGVALLDVARRTFGRDDPACWVVLLIYGLSAQMLVTAMTVYSMTAHMAFNLIWLAAFLRGGKSGHAIAIATGFVATGLHQLAFHPAFVAPFLLWRLRRGEYKLVAIYAAAYCAILLWWACYPLLAAQQVASSVAPPPNGSLMTRISTAFAERRGDTAMTMVFNLLRFIAWQNLALLPLLSASIAVAVRDRGLPAALLLGIVLWLAFITIVIPFQGHGWGYRYLHPYLGSFALLAGFGYRELRARLGRKVDGFVLSLSAVTALAAIPMSFAAAHRFVEQHLGLEALIASQTTPVVLIDTDYGRTTDERWPHNAIENVRNLPDLSNRPLRLSSRNLNAELLTRLCAKGPVTVITRSDQHRAGFALNLEVANPRLDRMIAVAERTAPGCFRKAAASRS